MRALSLPRFSPDAIVRRMTIPSAYCWRSLLASLSLALLLGCARTPTHPPLPPEAVVVAFGDSLTYGTGASPEESYPARLEKQLDRRVINAGVPGEVSAEGLARLPDVLDEHTPALLILCHGGNDMLRQLDRAALKANLRAMIALAQARNIPVLLIGVPEPKLRLNTAAVYEEIAQETGVLYEGGILASVLQWPSTKHDMIHPNAAGYAQIADALLEDLIEAGFAARPR